MATQSVMKTQARQTRPRATPRAFRPTCNTAATKVWTARSWQLKLYVSGVSHAKMLGEETHEDDQADSEFTSLFNNSLCCAIGPCRDDPVVGPPDIEDTTSRLQKVKYEKRELS
jgi:hypothetical protein